MKPDREPAITVVMPCYNLGRYLDQALDSVFAQTLTDVKVIVVDDGSTDEYTTARLQDLSRPEVTVLHQPNRGVAAARNAGIRATSSRFICCLDPDDRLRPAFFEKAIAVLESDPGIGFVSGWLEMFEARDETVRFDHIGFPELLVYNGVIVPALFRRSAWEQAGGYRETFSAPGVEDWDFWISLVEAGSRGHVLQEVVWEYRIHPGQMSQHMYRPETYGQLVRQIALYHADTYLSHWPAILQKYGERWAELKQWAEELEEGRGWLKSQADNWEQLAGQRVAERDRLEAHVTELERTVRELEAERQTSRQDLDDRTQVIERLEAWCKDLNEGRIRLQELRARREQAGSAPVTLVQDPENEWIRASVKGLTFADIGGLWQTVNEKVSLALQAGAAQATLVDITSLDSPLWDRFHDRLAALGITRYRCIEADLNNPLTVAELPEFDVVYCGGLIYHSPDPSAILAALARVTRRTLILGSAVIPSRIENSRGKLEVAPGEALFVPELDESQRTVVDCYFREAGAREMIGINAPSNWALDDHAPWWWLLTSEYVEALLRAAGFSLIERGEAWQGRTALFLASKAPGSPASTVQPDD